MESLDQKKTRLAGIKDQLENKNWNDVDDITELKEERDNLQAEIAELEAQFEQLPVSAVEHDETKPPPEAIPPETKTLPKEDNYEKARELFRKILPDYDK